MSDGMMLEEQAANAVAEDLLVEAGVLRTCERHLTYFRTGEPFKDVLPRLWDRCGKGGDTFNDMLKRCQAAYDEHVWDQCNPCEEDD
jgi:hypothetical protein